MNPAPHQPITFSKQGGLPSHHQSWVKWMSAKVTQRTEDMSSMGRGRKARIGKDLPGCLLFYSYDFPITSSTLKPLPCSQSKHDCVLLFTRGPHLALVPAEGSHSFFVRTMLSPLVFSATHGPVSSSGLSLSHSPHPLPFLTPPSLWAKPRCSRTQRLCLLFPLPGPHSWGQPRRSQMM